jgi:hypothetical protein
MGWRTAAEVDTGVFLLRLLIVGYAKVGKTTAAIVSSPGPVGVLNVDDDSGLRETRRQVLARAEKRKAEGKPEGGDHYVVMSMKTAGFRKWMSEIPSIKNDVEKGFIKTIVLDNLTMLSGVIMNEALRESVSHKGNEDPRRAHQLYTRRMLLIVGQLLECKCHVIVISHCPPPYAAERSMDDDGDKKAQPPPVPGGDDALIVPLLENKDVRARMPALFTDIVYMGYQGRTQKRYFLTGPRGAITGPGCRSLKTTVAMTANITVLLRAFRGEDISQYLIKE